MRIVVRFAGNENSLCVNIQLDLLHCLVILNHVFDIEIKKTTLTVVLHLFHPGQGLLRLFHLDIEFLEVIKHKVGH